MRILAPATEDEVIEAFVNAEGHSPRYGKQVAELLQRHAGDVHAVLAEYRAWGRDEGLFAGFPADVRWFHAELTSDELLDIRYINWDWWLRISGGSRRPRDAAARIRAGLVPGVSPNEDEPIARAATVNPPLIAVRASAEDPLVLLEGHTRITAYALFPQYLPRELEIFLGESPGMKDWSEY